jgi:hypothetical protein
LPKKEETKSTTVGPVGVVENSSVTGNLAVVLGDNVEVWTAMAGIIRGRGFTPGALNQCLRGGYKESSYAILAARYILCSIKTKYGDHAELGRVVSDSVVRQLQFLADREVVVREFAPAEIKFS